MARRPSSDYRITVWQEHFRVKVDKDTFYNAITAMYVDSQSDEAIARALAAQYDVGLAPNLIRRARFEAAVEA